MGWPWHVADMTVSAAKLHMASASRSPWIGFIIDPIPPGSRVKFGRNRAASQSGHMDARGEATRVPPGAAFSASQLSLAYIHAHSLLLGAEPRASFKYPPKKVTNHYFRAHQGGARGGQALCRVLGRDASLVCRGRHAAIPRLLNSPLKKGPPGNKVISAAASRAQSRPRKQARGR